MNILDKVESLKRLSVMFKDLADLSESLDQVKALDNHVKELEAQKELLLQDCKTLKEQADFENSRFSKIAENADIVVKRAEIKAQEIIKAAELQATQEREANILGAQEVQKELEAKVKEKDAEIDNRVKQLEHLRSECIKEQERLDNINAAIERIKGL